MNEPWHDACGFQTYGFQTDRQFNINATVTVLQSLQKFLSHMDLTLGLGTPPANISSSDGQQFLQGEHMCMHRAKGTFCSF